ncbi:MAG: hypothetical protein M3296_11205, partial [Actinomycetota bacterium]|nr:hypothetical protein [Actinomycetota bacterium]
MQRSTWAIAIALAGLTLLAPGVATADTYSVFSCRDPLGAANAASGWRGVASAGGIVSNGCPAGGALAASLPQARPAGNASAVWQFDAPAATRIVRMLARRSTSGLQRSFQTFDLAYSLETNLGLPNTGTLERCAPSTESSCTADVSGVVDKQGLDGRTLSFRALCTNAGGTCSGPMSFQVPQVVVGLEDRLAPAVSNARVLDDGDPSGTLAVGFNAADVGGGVYRALVKVDGRLAQAIPMAPAPCADVAPTDADPYQFNVPVPCPPLVTGAQARVAAASLPPGPHGVEVVVEDAAGNQTSVFGPVEFPRLNANAGSSVRSVLNARLRMWFVKAPHRGRRYTSRLGTRVVTRGVLRDRQGHGIQGARIDVYHIRNGRRRLVKTGLKTRRRGRLTLILPLNVDTRTIEYAFRAVRPGPITSRQRLRLTVRDRRGRIFHR